MDLTHLCGRTYTFSGRTLTMLYMLDDRRCVLFDNGYNSEWEDLQDSLDTFGLVPAAAVISHQHPDHHGNSVNLRREYGCPIIAPEGEAAMIQSLPALRYYHLLYTKDPDFPPLLEQHLYCRIDRMILPDADSIVIEGTEFGVVHLPGHCFDQCGFVTPDGVCFLADAMLPADTLARSKLPYCDCLQQYRESIMKAASLPYSRWVLSHKAALEGSLTALAEANISAVDRRMQEMYSLVTRPMTQSDFEAACRKELCLYSTKPSMMAMHARLIRPYMEELVQRNMLRLEGRDGTLYLVRV